MKAVMYTQYGGPEVLRLVEVPTPEPRPNEVLVKVYASTVTFGDCELRNLTLPAWTRFPMRLYMGYWNPKLIPGMEFAGVIERAGSLVSKFKVGEAVFGSTGMRMGGNAEYVSLPVTTLARKPPEVSFEDAATIPVGGINALHFLRMAEVKPGQKVLIIGAGGSIGTWGVQLAKHYGAEVTAVDHGDKLDMLRAIGADHTVNYMTERIPDQIKYDVVFDIVYQSQFEKCLGLLTDTGCYVMANPSPGKMLKAFRAERKSTKKVKFRFAAENTEDLHHLASLIASRKIKPVIDRVYPLEETMEAHRYVENGLKKGSVVVSMTVSSPKS